MLDSPEIQNLEDAATVVENTNLLFTILQTCMTYVYGSSLASFFALINSQQNLAYMPILSVNFPAQVSFYLDFLVQVASFDPIPIDIFFEVTGFWDFQWTDTPSSRTSYERIGIEDRIFVNVLGSMILFLAGFVATQAIAHALAPCAGENHLVRRLYRGLIITGSYRPIILLFYIEAYIDLFMGALINTENAYLLDEPTNWGWNGNLTMSDQFTVLLGYFFYYTCLIFPFVLAYLLLKHSKSAFMHYSRIRDFREKNGVLFEEFNPNNTGISNYYFVFMLRRIAYVLITYYAYEEQYTLLQVLVNLSMNHAFIVYLIHVRPFCGNEENNIQIWNEILYQALCYHHILFTDLNTDVALKFAVGWSMVFLSISNFVYPNLWVLILSLKNDYV